MIEKTLGLFDGHEVHTRVELVQRAEPGERPALEMRMQRDCPGLGWVTERRITLAAGQWGAMRDALNLADLDVREDRAPSRAAAADARASHLRLIG